MLAAWEHAIDGTPPAWVRKAETIVLMRVFAEAFDVQPPSLARRCADDALWAFREFTAACMEEALKDDVAAKRYRERLGGGARALGLRVRFAFANWIDGSHGDDSEPGRVRAAMQPGSSSDAGESVAGESRSRARSNAFRLVRFFYRGIGIELSGGLPGDVTFCPCSFARRYTPGDCWLMSAFDEGFMQGIVGLDARLAFSCRLTEGASCCRARFS